MDKDNIGKNLKEILDFLELTQVEAAEKIGITQAALSQILNGERYPSIDSIIRILVAFNIKFERLMK